MACWVHRAYVLYAQRLPVLRAKNVSLGSKEWPCICRASIRALILKSVFHTVLSLCIVIVTQLFLVIMVFTFLFFK